MDSSKLLQLLKNSPTDAELKDFWTDLGDTLLGTVTNAANGVLGSLSLTVAQLLASFSLSGGLNPIGKRDFWDDLANSLLGTVTNAANAALGSLSLTAAQLLASFGLSGGINPIGKRGQEQLRGFLDVFTASLADIFNTVLLPAVNSQLTNVSLLGAHALAGLSQENDIIGTLGTLFGKRSEEDIRGFLDSFTAALTGIFNEVFLPAINNQLTNVALLGAHVLGGLSQETDIIGTIGTLTGVGKRSEEDIRGFFELFTSTVTDIFNSVFLPAINNQLTNVALLGAHVLGGLSQETDIIGTIGTLTGVGKRETLPYMPLPDFFSQLGASMVAQITPVLQSALANISLSSATWLANFSQNGGLLG